MIVAEVMTGPRRIGCISEEEAIRIGPLELLEKLEEMLEMFAKTQSCGSTPCNDHIRLFVATAFGGWEESNDDCTHIRW